MNGVLAVFNLLPAAPLDGGRVVQALVWWRTGDRDRAEGTAARGGQVLGILLIALGWISVLRGVFGGLWLAVIGFFLVVVAGAELTPRTAGPGPARSESGRRHVQSRGDLPGMVHRGALRRRRGPADPPLDPRPDRLRRTPQRPPAASPARSDPRRAAADTARA
ncbi:site-2 protease family protein [Streptomyces sp. NPDC002787]